MVTHYKVKSLSTCFVALYWFAAVVFVMSSNGVLKNDSKARLSSPDVEPKQTNNNI